MKILAFQTEVRRKRPQCHAAWSGCCREGKNSIRNSPQEVGQPGGFEEVMLTGRESGPHPCTPT